MAAAMRAQQAYDVPFLSFAARLVFRVAGERPFSRREFDPGCISSLHGE